MAIIARLIEASQSTILPFSSLTFSRTTLRPREAARGEQIYFGIFGVWFGELFPTRLRSLGSAAAYNIGRGLAGIGTLIGGVGATTEGYGIAVSIAVVGAVLVFGAALRLRDRAGRVITAED